MTTASLAIMILLFAWTAQAEEPVPQWTDKISINGDFRFRHEYTSKAKASDNSATHKERMRLRLGINGKVNDKLNGKFRLATADGADPISTNSTFTDNASKKSIYIDVAAVEWRMCEDANLVLGKQDNNLRLLGSSQLLYDADYTPEGVSVSSTKPLFTRLGAYSIQERSPDTNGSSEPDSWLMAGLIGYQTPLSVSHNLMVGVGYHNFTALKKNAALGGGFLGNSNSGSRYTHDYQVAEALAEVKWKLSRASLSVHIDYIFNFTAEEKNTGVLAGAQYQTYDENNKPQWIFGYTYQATGKDATVSAINNSDLNNKIDGGFGHIVSAGRTVAANTTAGLTIFRGKVDNSGAPFWMDRAFADLVVSF